MTASTDAGAWRRLGALLIQRRTALSPRFHNRGAFCEATGLKYRLVYDIEEVRRTNFGNSTLAAIEAAYQLAPGSIRRFLAGGELEQPAAGFQAKHPRADFPFPAVTAEMAEDIEVQIEEIRRRVELAVRRQPGQALTGRQVFPLDTRSAQTWDRISGLGWEQEGVIRGMAMLMAWAAQEARGERENGAAAGLGRSCRLRVSAVSAANA